MSMVNPLVKAPPPTQRIERSSHVLSPATVARSKNWSRDTRRAIYNVAVRMLYQYRCAKKTRLSCRRAMWIRGVSFSGVSELSRSGKSCGPKPRASPHSMLTMRTSFVSIPFISHARFGAGVETTARQPGIQGSGRFALNATVPRSPHGWPHATRIRGAPPHPQMSGCPKGRVRADNP